MGSIKSRRKEARTLAYVGETYLAPDEETEAELARIKANKLKAMYCFKAELRRPAEDEAQIVRELHMRSADISRATHKKSG